MQAKLGKYSKIGSYRLKRCSSLGIHCIGKGIHAPACMIGHAGIHLLTCYRQAPANYRQVGKQKRLAIGSHSSRLYVGIYPVDS